MTIALATSSPGPSSSCGGISHTADVNAHDGCVRRCWRRLYSAWQPIQPVWESETSGRVNVRDHPDPLEDPLGPSVPLGEDRDGFIQRDSQGLIAFQ